MSTSVPPTPASIGYQLIPPDPGIVNPDLALDAALAPVVPVDPPGPRTFGRSWRFDFLEGQFVRDGTVPLVVYELDTLIMWVEHTLRTARLAHPIYQPAYGMDEPYSPIGHMAEPSILSRHQEMIEAALLFHDRIIHVENFSFSQDPFEEVLYASFTVLVNAASTLEPQPLEFSRVPIGQT
jgi:hypothetical protein